MDQYILVILLLQRPPPVVVDVLNIIVFIIYYTTAKRLCFNDKDRYVLLSIAHVLFDTFSISKSGGGYNRSIRFVYYSNDISKVRYIINIGSTNLYQWSMLMLVNILPYLWIQECME